MIVEIRGTGTVNKAPQFTLEAVVDQLGDEADLAAAPFPECDYSVRARLGLHQLLYIP